MANESQNLEEQLIAAFEEHNYPIENKTDLSPNFPSWANTHFEVHDSDISFTPKEILLLVPDEYPYNNVREFTESILDNLREEELIE